MQDLKRRGIEKSTGRRIGETSQAHGGITDRRNRCKLTSKTSQSQLPQCVMLLKASRNRLESESASTKGALGRDVDGNAIDCIDPGAVSLCVEGTLQRTCNQLKLSYRHITFCREILFAILKPRKFKSLITFNDAHTTTHFHVLSLFTRGIAAIEEALNYRSHFNYIRRGCGRLEKIVSNRQQKKEIQES